MAQIRDPALKRSLYQWEGLELRDDRLDYVSQVSEQLLLPLVSSCLTHELQQNRGAGESNRAS